MTMDKAIKGIVLGLAIGLTWDVLNKVAPNYFS